CWRLVEPGRHRGRLGPNGRYCNYTSHPRQARPLGRAGRAIPGGYRGKTTMKRVSLSALAILALCLSLGPGARAPPPPPPPLDYTIIAPRFAALPGTPTSRYWGIAAGAAYRIEVPAGWNGKLVLYAHGYRGTGPVLYVSNPVLREHFVRNGYAWAASSYSANFYDVRQGVLDTHALGGIFRERTGRAPSSTFVTGHSMGGHITGALIEQYPDAYVGALPMCGVMGDVALFDYFL